MSRLPISNTRINHETQPSKNRKVLGELNGQILNSPHYPESSSRHTLEKMSVDTRVPAPQLELLTKKPNRKSSIPTAKFSMTSKSRVMLRGISGASNDPGLNNLLGRTEQTKISRPTSFKFDMKDPDALKIHEQNERNLLKQVELQETFLYEVERQIKEHKEECNELSKKKSSMQAKISTIKNQIHENEISISSIDFRIEQASRDLETFRTHEEQMLTIKLKEEQNILIRELDELKNILDEEVEKNLFYKDEKSEREVEQLQKDIKKLEDEVKVIREATDERLRNEKKILEEDLQRFISDQESLNDAATKKYELELKNLEKSSKEAETQENMKSILQSEIEGLDKEIKEMENLEKHLANIEKDLSLELERLVLKDRSTQSVLEKTISTNEDITQEYNNVLRKFEKEQTVRRNIEYSIEELEARLRSYVRILGTSEDPVNFNYTYDEELHQSFTLNEEQFSFSKIFTTERNDLDVYKELEVFFQKNLLNAIDISLILYGIKTQSFIKEVISNIKNFMDRYNNFEINYCCEMSKLETLKIKENLLELGPLIDDSECADIVRFKIDFLKNNKKYQSTLTLLNLPNTLIDEQTLEQSFKVSLSKVNGIDYFKQSDAESLQINDLLHYIYSNSKVLTFFAISNSLKEQESNLKSLKLAKFVNSIESLPINRVYRNIFN
ncbi:hypothetical protein WICMUC_003709 [Wickerhamomyces mucosus]|uniref:Spindle pole body-associated protein Vik1/Cik1 microtubule binding domain-containing protein n=1 Tax=Wickerhamomyces mucosus TaxID=1378264 RepID=A0A9P8PLA2_9ASCO|nr:hypothetical protein WICMUC_003709 [Wickerhamomyces mucosus]